jgi:ABC-type multidrug transport system ATPase subunit
MLEIEAVSHTYPDGTSALYEVTLSIGRGLFGLLGPNGAGKSSLMRVAATLQSPLPGNCASTGSTCLPSLARCAGVWATCRRTLVSIRAYRRLDLTLR